MFVSNEHEDKLVGRYTKKERFQKIRKYQKKIFEWKNENKKPFNGRSEIAKTKPRYFGRFIKKEYYSGLLVSDEQVMKNNQIIDEATRKENYNQLVSLITQSPSIIN
jgi:hypothetical protein